jgi:hypothetical protein
MCTIPANKEAYFNESSVQWPLLTVLVIWPFAVNEFTIDGETI